jgi:hydrogenase maturation factor HypF (carbamoyltransferase family)
VLTEKCIELLEMSGFAVTFPTVLPVNDAGISFGQIVECGYQSG